MMPVVRGVIILGMAVLAGLALLAQSLAAPRPAEPATAAEPTVAPTTVVSVTVPAPTPRPPVVPTAVPVPKILRENPRPAPRPTVDVMNPKVAIVDYGFDPPIVRVKVGGSVEWRNFGRVSHDVMSLTRGDRWESGPLFAASTYSRVFSDPGTFSYYCTSYPDMRGQVIVE